MQGRWNCWEIRAKDWTARIRVLIRRGGKMDRWEDRLEGRGEDMERVGEWK